MELYTDMLLYIILISDVCVLSVVFFNKYTKKISPSALKTVFLIASFFLLFIYSAMRKDIGYDYLMYSQGFFRMGMSGFSEVGYNGWEWGFNILTKTIVFFTRDIHVYMAIITAICLAGPFYAIYRYSKKVWLSVLLYINLYFFYCTMNFLRQSIAISITLFAYTFLINRKFVRYVLLIIFAAAFHSTALIMLPVYFLVNFKPSPRVPLLYAYLILWTFISSNATLDLLTEYIGGEYRQSVFLTDGIAFVHIIIPTLIVGAGAFLLLKSIKLNNSININNNDSNSINNINNIPKEYKTVVMQTNLMYFSYFWLIVMLRHSVFERFSYYTYVFVILYIPEILAFIDETYKKSANKKFNILRKSGLSDGEKDVIIASYKKKRKVINFILIASVAVITISYNINGLLTGGRGVHGVYPYASWLK